MRGEVGDEEGETERGRIFVLVFLGLSGWGMPLTNTNYIIEFVVFDITVYQAHTLEINYND